MRRTRLKMRGTSDASVLDEQIQATLREITILRDGGCILRNYPGAGRCSGYRNDGELILQAEHLVTRTNSISFADTRNIVCLCKYHHITWKPQHSQLYWEFIEEIIGAVRWEWMARVQLEASAHKPYKVDRKLALIVLKQELAELKRR